MEHFNYKPTGVCSRNIEIELNGNRIEKVAFTGGCSGNTQGIAALIVGMDFDGALAHRRNGHRRRHRSPVRNSVRSQTDLLS